VLYRLFFRHVAALDTAAAQLDAAGKAGGNALRTEYQNSLFLSDAQAALLRQNAVNCNSSLDQQHASALPTITAARASIASLPAGASIAPSPALTATLATLEQARTDISNACIASLHAGLGDQMFSNIDVFVRTKFVRQVSTVPPPGAPFGATPPTRIGASASVKAPLSTPGGGR